MKPRALIFRTAGTNCDLETAHALELAGATSERVHVNRLLEAPNVLREYQLIAFPGGFSYGDDIAAGKIFANQIAGRLGDALKRCVEDGKPVIGICNGFQVLVKTDLLPGQLAGRCGQTCTLAHNDGGRFIDRWIRVAPRGSKCIWTRGLGEMDLPIAHGEGKFVPSNPEVRKALHDNDQIALTYVNGEISGDLSASDGNPNGSTDSIAGVCDSSGLVFGLMPHPERHVYHFQHPARRDIPEGAGLSVFRNAVRFLAS